MHILALDTSTSACSVALWDGASICAERFAEMARGQSEHLIPMVGEVLGSVDAKVADMDMIAVTTGPGAFTGVRIGLSAARGLSLASAKPLRGVSTLDALAHGVSLESRSDRTVLALIDSKRGDLFSQCFDSTLRAVGDPEALEPNNVVGHWSLRSGDKVVLCGDAADKFEGQGLDMSFSTSVHPKAATIARMAAARGLPLEQDQRPAPLYLRPPDVKVPTDGGRLRP